MPARKKRRRGWYDREFTPTDQRLWLYGPVPPGFWQSSENRHLYMEWLGEQLGFTHLEDWYQITTEDFKRRRGAGLLARFHDSAVALVKDYRRTMNGSSGISPPCRRTMVPLLGLLNNDRAL